VRDFRVFDAAGYFGELVRCMPSAIELGEADDAVGLQDAIRETEAVGLSAEHAKGVLAVVEARAGVVVPNAIVILA
jgi:hypothetical protein